jgi:hypothetical protein
MREPKQTTTVGKRASRDAVCACWSILAEDDPTIVDGHVYVRHFSFVTSCAEYCTSLGLIALEIALSDRPRPAECSPTHLVVLARLHCPSSMPRSRTTPYLAHFGSSPLLLERAQLSLLKRFACHCQGCCQSTLSGVAASTCLLTMPTGQ